jgi:methionyl aminopeptidase
MIMLKSPDEIERMRRASGIVAEILAEVAAHVRPGVSTAELDSLAEELTSKHGAKPAFKGYVVGGRSFPATICISINDEVVHGIPSARRVLREGDIVGLDFGVCYDGYFGDAARTVGVGSVSADATRLMSVTAAALAAGIEAIRPGAYIADISGAIQDVAEGASAWCASSSGTASAGSSTRTPRCRTTAPGRAGSASRRAWCWRSSRWSTPAARRCT